MNDKFAETIISRAGVVKVRNAMNALLWLTAICLPTCALCVYFFYNDPILRYVFSAAFMLPLLGSLTAYFWLLLKDPDRLQSEEFVLRQQELLIEYKGVPSILIDRTESEDTVTIDANPEGKSKGEKP